MIFSKKTWHNGDKVNATEMNRIENGVYEANSKLDAIGTALTIQSGRVSVDTSGHRTSGITKFEKHIDFPTSFSQKPYVVVSPDTGSPNEVMASVKGSSYVTNTGFTLVVYRSSNSDSTSVSWIATAPTA